MDKSVGGEDSSDLDEDHNESPAESGFETEEEVLADGDMRMSEPPAMAENRYRRTNQPPITQEQPTMTENRYKRNNQPSTTRDNPAVSENRYKRPDSRMNNFPSTAQQPSVAADNRYRRPDPRANFQQPTARDNSVPNGRGPDVRGAFRSAPSDLNQNRHTRPGSYTDTEGGKQGVTSGSRNPMPHFQNIGKGGGIAHPSTSNARRSGYGVFSPNKGLDTPDA